MRGIGDLVYRTQKLRLSEVQLVKETDNGRVMVCEDLNSAERVRYSVYETHDHDIIARLHRVYSASRNISSDTEINYFSDAGQFLVFYPYVEQRPISSFYMGKHMDINLCETICKNYIITCMTSELPWPVLYLAISQGQVNMARDGSVFLSYVMDLSDVDENITERDCVKLCADDMISMLMQKEEKLKWDLRDLLLMKQERLAFSSFVELYRDVDLVSGRHAKRGLLRRLMVWFEDNKDRMFRIFLTICVILLIFTLITFLTNAIFGDVPWLRFFIRSFEKIGEESLVQ